MTQEYFFKIDDRKIILNFKHLKKNDFVIKSNPYNYSISFIEDNELKSVFSDLRNVNDDKNFFFVDKKVDMLYKKIFWPRDETLRINAIEKNKTINSALIIIAKLNQINFTKEEVFISIGGGITQDVSAFARSVFKRGIIWNYIPTTLLAMSDSCIGSKSAINYHNTKNLIGLFSAPHSVYININFLKSLDIRDVLSGYGEIIKLCIVGGLSTINYFKEVTSKQNGELLTNISQLIKISLLVKKSVIEIDEFEYDIRKALNYGHTVGHAIEPLVKFKIPHGIAVMIGIVVENEIATYFGNLNKNESVFLNKILVQYIDDESLFLLKNIDINEIFENMLKDKKNQKDIINFAVPFSIGSFGIIKVKKSEKLKKIVSNAINNVLNLKYK